METDGSEVGHGWGLGQELSVFGPGDSQEVLDKVQVYGSLGARQYGGYRVFDTRDLGDYGVYGLDGYETLFGSFGKELYETSQDLACCGIMLMAYLLELISKLLRDPDR
jgi:hypothetical protein